MAGLANETNRHAFALRFADRRSLPLNAVIRVGPQRSSRVTIMMVASTPNSAIAPTNSE